MLSLFSKYIVYPSYYRYRGLSVYACLSELKKNQQRSKEEIKNIQWDNLKQLLHHAYRNVPFYSIRMQQMGCHPADIRCYSDFSKLPFLTKEDILQNAESMIAAGFPLKSLIPDSTGGSTGQTIHFYENRCELSYRFAAAIRSDAWAGHTIGGRYAQVWGAAMDLSKGSGSKKIMDQWLLRRMFISSFNLSEKDLQKAVDAIKHFKPEVIIGYPTPLHRLSLYLLQNERNGLRVKSVISSAETLHDFQKEDIEQAFHCRVFNRYGCREFGPIAAECEEHDGMHLLTDRLMVELLPVDTDKTADPVSEVVITDLHKYGMPFIRYKTGDSARLSKNDCSCGRPFPMIHKIQGRIFDMILCPDGNFISGTFWTLLFRSVPGICSFQVFQEEMNKIRITLQVTEEFQQEYMKKLKRDVQDRCGKEMNVRYILTRDPIPSESGKHRFVISAISKAYFSSLHARK